MRTDTFLIFPCFLETWTEINALTITESSSLRLRKLALEVSIVLMSLGTKPLNVTHTIFKSILLTLSRKMFTLIASSDYETMSICLDFFQTMMLCCQVDAQATFSRFRFDTCC